MEIPLILFILFQPDDSSENMIGNYAASSKFLLTRKIFTLYLVSTIRLFLIFEVITAIFLTPLNFLFQTGLISVISLFLTANLNTST